MSLVVFTSYCGMMLAPGNIHPFIASIAILCITIGAGSAAAINMWYDRDIDSVMKRTLQRPIIRGVIEPDEALSFGIILAFLSSLLMALCVNIISAALLIFTILYYIFVYTIWLKRSSIYNVVIGGVAGAVPPMIGWAAVTNDISFESLILFAIIFMWTPPHSWALALFRNEDYKSCSVPMMPVIKGEYYTKKQILIYSVLMVATSILPYFFEMAGEIYLIIAIILGIIFMGISISLFNDKNYKRAKQLFVYSIFYLFILFFILLIQSFNY
jgi:protoheme IX farnesyltransferase